MKKASKKDCERMTENLDDAKGALQLINRVLEDKLNNRPKWPDPESFMEAFGSHVREIREILDKYRVFVFEDHKFEIDENDFVNFGDVALGILNKQSQYASRYVDGRIDDRPNLGKGLRFEGDPADYHFLKIHKDDIAEFIKRVREYQSRFI